MLSAKRLRELVTYDPCTGIMRWRVPRPKVRAGYKGVVHKDHLKKWQAQMSINNRNIYLGIYDTPEEAHEAYMAKAMVVHGAFARAA